MPTVRRAHLLMVFATAFAMVGCAAMRRHEARDTGDLLVSAGFTTKPADTPERAQELHAMPPLKLVSQSKDGHVVYRYADPYTAVTRGRGGSRRRPPTAGRVLIRAAALRRLPTLRHACRGIGTPV